MLALIQLTYIPLTYTCIQLLHCPMLPSSNSTARLSRVRIILHVNLPSIAICFQRWYLDGTVECFGDPAHLAMGILAIVFLVGLILLIPLVVLLVVFEWHPLIQASLICIGIWPCVYYMYMYIQL